MQIKYTAPASRPYLKSDEFNIYPELCAECSSSDYASWHKERLLTAGNLPFLALISQIVAKDSEDCNRPEVAVHRVLADFRDTVFPEVPSSNRGPTGCWRWMDEAWQEVEPVDPVARFASIR